MAYPTICVAVAKEPEYLSQISEWAVGGWQGNQSPIPSKAEVMLLPAARTFSRGRLNFVPSGYRGTPPSPPGIKKRERVASRTWPSSGALPLFLCRYSCHVTELSRGITNKLEHWYVRHNNVYFLHLWAGCCAWRTSVLIYLYYLSTLWCIPSN